jgi:hypothetical protein
MGAFQTVDGEQSAELKITGSPGNFGQFLTLKVENAAGQAVTDIHLLYPGFDYGSAVTFLPEFIGLLKSFRALRFMAWERTNNNPLTSWAERPAAHFGHSGLGQPYEHLVLLSQFLSRSRSRSARADTSKRESRRRPLEAPEGVNRAPIAWTTVNPKRCLRYVAKAPYFGADDAQSGSLSALFTGMAADIAAKDATYADFKQLVGEWGLSMSAYEGGAGADGHHQSSHQAPRPTPARHVHFVLCALEKALW